MFIILKVILMYLPECSCRDELRMKGLVKCLFDGIVDIVVERQNDRLVDRKSASAATRSRHVDQFCTGILHRQSFMNRISIITACLNVIDLRCC